MKSQPVLQGLLANYLQDLFVVMPSVALGVTLSVWVLDRLANLENLVGSAQSVANVGRGVPNSKWSDRPTSVITMAVMEILTGGIFLLGGAALLSFAGAGSSTLQVFGAIHLPVGASFLALGVLSLFSTRRWVWTLGLALVIISIVDDLVALIIVPLPSDGVIGTAVVLATALVTLYCLARGDARSFFEGPLELQRPSDRRTRRLSR